MKVLRSLRKSKLARDVSVVASGTAGAQAIGMVFAPFITRLYGPEAFGLQGSFLALLGIVTPIAALCFPIAIVLPRSDRDARGLVRLSLIISATLATASLVALLLFADSLTRLLNAEAIRHFLWLIPVGMLLATWQSSVQQWAVRKKLYKITAKTGVFQALLMGATKTGIGFFYPLAAVLVVVGTVGSALQATMLTLGVKRWERANAVAPEPDEPRPSLKELAKRYRDFPLYRAPQVFLNSFSQSLPALLLATYFGPAAVGFYALARTVITIPTKLVGGSVATVFYPRITEAAHNKENLVRLIFKATSALAAAGILPFAAIIVLGPWLFEFAFGSEWRDAGNYSRWLAVWLYFAFINRPSVAAIATLNLQGFFLIYEIASVGLRVAALFVGFHLFSSDVIAVALFSLAGAALNISLILITLYKSRNFTPREST